MPQKLALLVLIGALGHAQQTPVQAGPQPGKLALVFPAIVDYALSGAGALAPALRQGIASNWLSLNSAVVTQLSNLPMPSPASGVRNVLDPNAGTTVALPQSFGPVLSERAESIGKGKFFFAVSHQRFSFDQLDDMKLSGFEVVSPITAGGLRVGLLNADGYINVNISQTTAHFTYGVTPWLDASYAFPLVTSRVTVRGNASLTESIAPFAPLPLILLNLQSTGLGDGTLRLKARLPVGNDFGVALATDVRLPIGDEFNYHGAGAWGLKETVILSWNKRKIAPHLNLGYQWNGESSLSTYDPQIKRGLPAQAFYAAGFDSAVSERVTFAFDLLQQTIIRGQRTFLRPYTTRSGAQKQEIYFQDKTRHEMNLSFGIKAQLRKDLLVTGNLMARLNEVGIRARVVPFLGLSYIF